MTPSPICCSISVRVKFCEKIMPKCSCWNNSGDLKIPINIPLKTISWPKFKSIISTLVLKSDRIWLIEVNFHTIGQLKVKVLDQNSLRTQFTILRQLKLIKGSFQLRLEILVFNPNQCGLFGQLRRRGGVKMTRWEIAVSGHSNFGTDQTNIVSYESWHLQLKFETSLRLLRLIVWPQEVSEVTEVKMKKIWGENPRITNFWLTET